QNKQLLAEIRRMAREPFNLMYAPLLRCHLFRLGQSSHVIFLNVHHILADRWSMGILQHEITSLYASLASKSTSSLSPLTLQYTDYTAQERMAGYAEKQLAYWKTKLKDAPPALELPFSKQRPSMHSFNGSIESFNIPSALAQPLRSLARRKRASLYILLLAAF